MTLKSINNYLQTPTALEKQELFVITLQDLRLIGYFIVWIILLFNLRMFDSRRVILIHSKVLISLTLLVKMQMSQFFGKIMADSLQSAPSIKIYTCLILTGKIWMNCFKPASLHMSHLTQEDLTNITRPPCLNYYYFWYSVP